MEPEPMVTTAEHVATEGAAVAMRSFRSGLPVETKTDRKTLAPTDVVTEADRAAQRRIIEILETRTTDDMAVVAEEGSIRKTIPESETAWVIDPIDGTYNYVRGISRWATSVAAFEEGQTLAAATAAPAIDDVYLAGTNAATRNGQSIAVSDRSTAGELVVAPVMLPPVETRGSYSAGVRSALDRFADVRRIGSLQLALALVAAGAIDIATTPRTPNPWDSIAGVRLIRAAGGRVTDAAGRQWTPGSDGLVASNGRVHETALEIVSRFGP